MQSQIIFGDERLKKEFESLSSLREAKLHDQIKKAFLNLQEDAFCGIQIPKRLIPKEYLKKYKPKLKFKAKTIGVFYYLGEDAGWAIVKRISLKVVFP